MALDYIGGPATVDMGAYRGGNDTPAPAVRNPATAVPASAANDPIPPAAAPSAPPPPPPAASAPTPPPAPATAAPSTLLADLMVQFPWLKSIGLDAAWFQQLAATTTNEADAVATLRGTNQYKARFAGILRDDGSMRMNEAQYINQENSYRQLLTQYGVDASAMDNPADFVGFFNSDVDPNELKQRLDVYKNVKDGGQDAMDAFYVYAGMRVGVDDLYAAAVDPAAAQRLTDEYNQKVAAQPLDYATWITRATQAGMTRVASTLTSLQTSGALTGNAVQSILRTDPDFARTIMDALYHGGDPTSGQTLGLQDLLATFEEATLGAAALGAGLTLPDKERIQALRSAGVTRAAAQQAYSQFAGNQNLYSGSVQRMAQSSRSFTQSDFEDAALLNKGTSADLLSRAQKQEDSYGQDAGQFQFDQNKRKQFVQSGLRTL